MVGRSEATSKMTTPSTRPTRSRYNSPFGLAPNNSASETPKINADGERPKTLLDKWVEPSLAPPRPSFAEAGIERHGVVAGMSPLGALPTAKVMKAATTAIDTGGRGAAGKKTTPSASTPGESNATATATPEPTPIPSRPSSSQAKAEEPTPAPTPTPAPAPVAVSAPAPTPLPAPVSVPTPPPPVPLSVTTPTLLPAHTPRPAPQTPQQQMSPRRYVPAPSITQQKMGQSVFALARPAHTLPHPVAIPAPPPAMYQHPRYQPAGDSINIEFTDKVVEVAVQEAVDQKRWPTAWALRTLYDDHRKNERMVRLIDAICTENADATQVQEFKNVMKHKKKEGKKDRTGEYYFCGDGSDPAPQTHSSAVNANASTYSTPSGRSGSGARTMSDAQARRSSFALSSMSASPHKEYEHVNKKHKGNNFPSSNMEMNGNGNANAENGAKIRTPQKQPHGHQNGTSNSRGRGRGDSISSCSSLSSVDEQVLDGGEYANTGDSSRIPQDSQKDTAGRASGVAAPTQAHHRSTPYANAKNSASAETHARPGERNQPGPITAPTTKGPKTYTFSTVTSSSPAAALSSSTNNHANSANTNHRPNSSANNSMAPAALLPSTTLLSTTYQPPTSIVFKTKKDLNKASARASYDENDSTTGRMKRDARKVTEKNTSTAESFERGRERHQISLPLLPEFESASDGGDSVAAAVTGPKRGTKIRLLNHKKSTRQTGVNYDSDSLSSPTALSFAPDIAPGSLSVSRAGTPNTFNRPTRKAKTGTGLRVKTS